LCSSAGTSVGTAWTGIGGPLCSGMFASAVWWLARIARRRGPWKRGRVRWRARWILR